MNELLLIDKDIELCSMLEEYLGRNGFRVCSVHRADLGLKALREHSWALVLLDVMLPDMNGFGVLNRIRAESSISILLLADRNEDVDRIIGLEIGADDYLPKPFNPRELLARIRAILRRKADFALFSSGVLHVQELELDPAARQVTRCGENIELTDVEFSLLEMLMRSPGRVVGRDELSAKTLGRAFDPSDRSLDVHMSRLRRKLAQQNGNVSSYVKTIRGVGYQLLIYRSATATEQ